MSSGPALVSILRQGLLLIASVRTALDDSEMLRFRGDLVDQIGRYRARGVVIDVAALDVIDSFGFHTLRGIAELARLRGAETSSSGSNPTWPWPWSSSGWGPGRSPPLPTSRRVRRTSRERSDHRIRAGSIRNRTTGL